MAGIAGVIPPLTWAMVGGIAEQRRIALVGATAVLASAILVATWQGRQFPFHVRALLAAMAAWKRRRFQFHIRTLLAATTACAILFAGLRREKPREEFLSGPICRVVNGFHDPNTIVYDELRLRRFIQDSRFTACGSGTYFVLTARGLLSVGGGLEPSRLGRRFHYQHLITFLEARPGREHLDKSYLGCLANLDPKLRLISPWEQDLMGVIGLVGAARVTEAIPMLTKLAKDRNPQIRRSVIFALGALGEVDETAIPPLIEALDDKGENNHNYYDARRALVRIGPPAVPFLLESLRETRPYGEGLSVFAELGPRAKDYVPDLVPMLEGPKGCPAAFVLGAIGEEAKEAVPGMLPLLHSADPLDRAGVARALGRIGSGATQAVSNLIALLEDSDAGVRLAAVEALGRIGSDARGAVAKLVAILKSRGEAKELSEVQAHAAIRAGAAEALGRIGAEPERVVPVLVEVLRPTNWSHVCEKAAEALGKFGARAEQAVPVLVEAMEWGSDSMRRAAAEALDRIGPGRGAAVPKLIEDLKQCDDRLRRFHAAEALGELGADAHEAIPALAEAAQDSDSWVKTPAARALERIKRSLRGPALRSASLASSLYAR